MIEVAASTVVKFGSAAAAGALVVFELDDAMNDGKTSFAPGKDIFLRLHHDSSVRLSKDPLATHGQIDNQGTGYRSIEQQLLWEDSETEHDLSYVPVGLLDASYYGNEASNLAKSGDRTVTIGGGDLPALSLVSYSAEFFLFRLIAPEVELEENGSYPVVVVAYMEEV